MQNTNRDMTLEQAREVVSRGRGRGIDIEFELPTGELTPEKAASIMMGAAQTFSEALTFTLMEYRAAQKVIAAHAAQATTGAKLDATDARADADSNAAAIAQAMLEKAGARVQ